MAKSKNHTSHNQSVSSEFSAKMECSTTFLISLSLILCNFGWLAMHMDAGHWWKANRSNYAYEVIIIQVGYSFEDPNGNFVADGSITLLMGNMTVLVDSGGPNDGVYLLSALESHGVRPANIDVVVGTHGHSDHIGNLNLFPRAKFIVNNDINERNVYFYHNFTAGPLILDEHMSVMSTPGHSGADVSVLVTNTQHGTVLVAGDLFESEKDLDDPSLWQGVSLLPEVQERSRNAVLAMNLDYIIPGHGPMFKPPKKDQ